MVSFYSCKLSFEVSGVSLVQKPLGSRRPHDIVSRDDLFKEKQNSEWLEELRMWLKQGIENNSK